MKFIWDSPLCAEFPSSPSSLRFGFEFSSFGVFCVWRRQSFEFVFWWTLCDDSNPSSLVTNPLELRVLTNWSFLRSWENPNPLWSSLEFSSSFNLLGEISWGYVHGTVVKVSSKFRWIWISFAQDSTFEALFTGSLGATGLTGQTGVLYRSDRSLQSSSAICIVLTLLLPRSFLGLFARR